MNSVTVCSGTIRHTSAAGSGAAAQYCPKCAQAAASARNLKYSMLHNAVCETPDDQDLTSHLYGGTKSIIINQICPATSSQLPYSRSEVALPSTNLWKPCRAGRLTTRSRHVTLQITLLDVCPWLPWQIILPVYEIHLASADCVLRTFSLWLTRWMSRRNSYQSQTQPVRKTLWRLIAVSEMKPLQEQHALHSRIELWRRCNLGLQYTQSVIATTSYTSTTTDKPNETSIIAMSICERLKMTTGTLRVAAGR